VLVVGFGNSACEQALDLVERGAEAHLSVRSPVNVVPRDAFGVVPILRLALLVRHLPPRMADALAFPVVRLSIGDVRDIGLRRASDGPITQIARHQQVPVLDVGTIDEIRAGRIAVHGAIERFTEDGVVFADGEALAVDAVVLGTGFRAAVDDFLVGWEAVCDSAGTPRTSGDPTGIPGLHFCGMRISSGGMLREISRESRRIAATIAAP
jgi:cation diffusion facilitator CzcD-associated flavoprotein CzcO